MTAFKHTALILSFFALGLCTSCHVADDDCCPDVPSINIFNDVDYPRWGGPNGSSILYYSSGLTDIIEVDGRLLPVNENDSAGVWVMDTDGTNRRMLLNTITPIYADWSPDGAWLVLHLGAQIYKASFPPTGMLDPATFVQLTFDEENASPEWSPDGEWIGYNRIICKEPANCGARKVHVNNGEDVHMASISGPSWHPDGDKIIGVKRITTIINSELKIIYYDVGRDRLLETLDIGDIDSPRDPKLSPNGETIAFYGDWEEDDLSSIVQIWTMKIDGTQLAPLIEHGIMPDWGPGGNEMVYIDINKGIAIADADGGNQRIIRPIPGIDTYNQYQKNRSEKSNK